MFVYCVILSQRSQHMALFEVYRPLFLSNQKAHRQIIASLIEEAYKATFLH